MIPREEVEFTLAMAQKGVRCEAPAKVMEELCRVYLASQWQPIETAPEVDPWTQDIATCLVFSPRTGVQLGRAWRFPNDKAKGDAFGFSGDDWGITHWMPRPGPPA